MIQFEFVGSGIVLDRKEFPDATPMSKIYDWLHKHPKLKLGFTYDVCLYLDHDLAKPLIYGDVLPKGTHTITILRKLTPLASKLQQHLNNKIPCVFKEKCDDQIILRTLIDLKADLMRRFYYNQTLLHKTASINNMDSVRSILAQKVDPNIRNNHGSTPLH